MQSHTLVADAHCDVLCSQLIYTLLENRSFDATKSPVISHRGLGRLIYQIHSHYNDDWDIDKFMQYCQVSKSQLFRLFQETFNQSPLRWLKNYRLSQARRLLVETEETISRIAGLVGYNDPLHFPVIFIGQSVYPQVIFAARSGNWIMTVTTEQFPGCRHAR